jgi:hypothetical protein
MNQGHLHPSRFDFKEPHNTAVVACRKVVDGAPILYVSHDSDGDWQFLCGGDHEDTVTDGAVMRCLGCMVAGDQALNNIAGLGRDQVASRERVGAPWTSPDADPRWLQILERPWTCSTCGERHEGLFDLACSKPEQWPETEQKKPNSEAHHSQHFLSEDFCILEGEHFFVRCVLDVPLIGSGGRSFGYGVWSTLSRKNFLLYRETFDSGEQGDLGPWFGWFSNRLKGYPDTLNLKCQVHPRAGRQRPWVELEATDHPLALEQRNGISFDRFVEILALHGHGWDRALLN